MNYKAIVKKIMREEGITPAQMAHRLTVNENLICREYNIIRWANGQFTPSPSWQARIRAVFDEKYFKPKADGATDGKGD